MERNGNLWMFLESHYLCSGNLRKKSNFDLSKNHECPLCKESKFSNLLSSKSSFLANLPKNVLLLDSC